MFQESELKSELNNFINQKKGLIILKLGHISLNDSLYKIKILDSPQCQCGFERQNLDHILWCCINFSQERKVLLDKLAKYNLFPPLTVNTFLVKPNIKVMKFLLDFVKKCNLVI